MKTIAEKHFAVKLGVSIVSLYSFPEEEKMILIIQDSNAKDIFVKSYRNVNQIEVIQNSENSLLDFLSVSQTQLEDLKSLYTSLGKVIKSFDNALTK